MSRFEMLAAARYQLPRYAWTARPLRISLTPPVSLALILILASAFRLATAGAIGLGNGEAYHFSCSIRPSLSYFDHPPLAVLLANVSMRLAGSAGLLALRVPFILLFAGTTTLLYLIGKRLFGEMPALYAALLLNLSAVFTFSVAMFLQSDGPLMFFWLACTYCLVRIFFDSTIRRPTAWWSLVGVTLGLAMLSKYHAVFVLFGAGMFCILEPGQRKWLRHPGPYLAIAIAAAIFSPVIVWNQQHQWISFLWQGSRGADYQGLRLDWLARNIGGQALWLLPWIWLPLLLELPRCFRLGRTSPVHRFIAWMAAAPIVVFTAISAYAPIGYHFHWQAPGYILLFLPLGATLYERLQGGDRNTLIWWRFTTTTTIVCLLMLSTHAATGWWTKIGPQWLSNNMGESDDPTLECLDYKPLQGALEDRGLFRRPDVFLFTNRWFQSGKVDFAVQGRMPVFCFNRDDQRSWAFFNRPDEWIGKNGVLISTKKFLDDAGREYGAYFKKVAFLGEVPVYRGGQIVERLQLHYCEDLRKPYPHAY